MLKTHKLKWFIPGIAILNAFSHVLPNAQASHTNNRSIYATDISSPSGSSIFRFPTSLPTAGGVCTWNGDSEPVSVAPGTSGNVLTSNGSAWVSAAPSSSIAWGSITGTLSSQTDLQTALNGKEPTLTKGNLSTSTAGITITGGSNAVIGSGATINIQNAPATNPGLLSSTDWNTFNGKASLSTANTWTATQVFTPSNTAANGIIAKPPSSSTGKIFTIQNTGGTNYFYADGSSTPVFHVSGDMRFHNIAGGSLLALDVSNNIRGISTLTNINYNYGANALTAIPSGSNGAYQFANGSGLFGADSSHAKYDLADNHSEFFGNTIVPVAPSGSSNYDLGSTSSNSFTTGYSAASSTSIQYQLYTKETIAGADVFSPYYMNGNVTVPASSITLSTPQNPTNTGASIGSGSYVNQAIQYRIMAVGEYNNNYVYSPISIDTVASDYSSTPFTVTGIGIDPFTFPNNAQTTQYRVLRSLDSGVTYDWYRDVSSLPFDDDGTGWSQVAVTNVTASINYGSGSYTANGTQRDYQVYAGWTDPNTSGIVYTYLGTTSQNSVTDDNSSNPYRVYVYWDSFTFPVDSTGQFYRVIRQVNGGGFNQYFDAGTATSMDDYDDSLWTNGDANPKWNLQGKTSVPDFFQVDFTWGHVSGNNGYKLLRSIDGGSTWGATNIAKDATTFVDTGGLPWSDSTTVTPTSAGPFGAKLGNNDSGLNTIGPLKVNDTYYLPLDDPGNAFNYVPVRNQFGVQMTWMPFNLGSIPGVIQNSQLPYNATTSGNILFSSSNSLSISSSGTLDYGGLYKTLRAPTLFAGDTGSSGLQLADNNFSPQWQLYAGKLSGNSNSSLLLYNLQGGSYGPKMLFDGDNSSMVIEDDNSTSRPSGKAILEMRSTTKGLLPPRMTTTQKNAISSPDEGLIVYDTTLHQLCYYNATSWVCN